MHKFNRDPVAPACLVGKTDSLNRWSELYTNSDARDEIWVKLEAMQGNRCAYCECAFNGKARHIEHFKSRNRFPESCFDWTNLFGSCPKTDSCGNYKDKDKNSNYDPDHLIKPDIDNPSEYLMFTSDGSVAAKVGLNQTQNLKAATTIATFNLNGPLRQQRERVLDEYRPVAQFYFETLVRELSINEWQALYQAKLLEIDQQPFCTAIRQMFEL